MALAAPMKVSVKSCNGPFVQDAPAYATLVDENEELEKRNAELSEQNARLKEANVLMQNKALLALETSRLLQEHARLKEESQAMLCYPMAIDPWKCMVGFDYAGPPVGKISNTSSKKSKVWSFLRREQAPPDEVALFGYGSESSTVSTSVGTESVNGSAMVPPPGFECEPPASHSSTMILRNVPNQYSRELLVELFEAHGFKGCFNLVYLPVDFQTRHGLGYAFVNLISVDEGLRFREMFSGFSDWCFSSEKICEVSLSDVQGLEAHLGRYRNSPVMHPSVPDLFKPALYKDGERISFPPPTKNIRAPRLWSRRAN